MGFGLKCTRTAVSGAGSVGVIVMADRGFHDDIFTVDAVTNAALFGIFHLHAITDKVKIFVKAAVHRLGDGHHGGAVSHDNLKLCNGTGTLRIGHS